MELYTIPIAKRYFQKKYWILLRKLTRTKNAQSPAFWTMLKKLHYWFKWASLTFIPSLGSNLLHIIFGFIRSTWYWVIEQVGSIWTQWLQSNSIRWQVKRWYVVHGWDGRQRPHTLMTATPMIGGHGLASTLLNHVTCWALCIIYYRPTSCHPQIKFWIIKSQVPLVLLEVLLVDGPYVVCSNTVQFRHLVYTRCISVIRGWIVVVVWSMFCHQAVHTTAHTPTHMPTKGSSSTSKNQSWQLFGL